MLPEKNLTCLEVCSATSFLQGFDNSPADSMKICVTLNCALGPNHCMLTSVFQISKHNTMILNLIPVFNNNNNDHNI